MRGRNTRIISARVHDSVYLKAAKQAAKKKRTVSEWLRIVIEKELER